MGSGPPGMNLKGKGKGKGKDSNGYGSKEPEKSAAKDNANTTGVATIMKGASISVAPTISKMATAMVDGMVWVDDDLNPEETRAEHWYNSRENNPKRRRRAY